MTVLGFDTSNYTTSMAAFDGVSGENQSSLLPVPPGELGLRQSDALFFMSRACRSLPAGCFPMWTEMTYERWGSVPGPGR